MNQLKVTKRKTALKAIGILDKIDLAESSDESVDQDIQSSASSSESELSDCSDSEKGIPDSPPTSTQYSVNSSTSKLVAEWQFLKVNSINHFMQGKARAHNVFRESPGVKPYVKHLIQTELDSWRFFMKENIIRHIYNCTVKNFHAQNDLHSFEISDLEKFIALQHARGLYGKNHSPDFLWSEDFGIPLFRKVMSRNTFMKIKKYIRFDDKQTRSVRIVGDPFAHLHFVAEEIT